MKNGAQQDATANDHGASFFDDLIRFHGFVLSSRGRG